MKQFIVLFFLTVTAVQTNCGGHGGCLKKQLGEFASRKPDCNRIYSEFVSEELRRDVTEEEFIRLCRQERVLCDFTSGKVPANPEIVYRATVRLADGRQFFLLFEDGRWKLDSDLLEFYPANTPQQALASFIKAFESKRWDIVASFMPASYSIGNDEVVLKKYWEEGEFADRIRELVVVLKQHLGDDIMVYEDRAELRFAPGHRVELVKEAGRWKIREIK